MVAVMMGSGETTFYVLAVYFGAVGIVKTRQAVPAGIIADIAAVLASVWVVNLIFGP
jgi:spore maturation protein B